MIPEEEWTNKCAETAAQLRLQMMPFITPISRAHDDGGEHVGTGGYVDFGSRRLLLTNKHVADNVGVLAHKFYDSEQYFAINRSFQTEPHPTDLAIAEIDQAWDATDHSAMAFPKHRMATSHAPIKRELLFMMGFAGKRSYYSPFDNFLVTNGTPYLSQEFDPTLEPAENARTIRSQSFDPRFHFALHWRPEMAVTLDQNRKEIPADPHGFSGSLVWNTRRLEFDNKQADWTPGVARLTGIVWGWDTSDRLLFVTKIEHIITFLKTCIETVGDNT
jgi:hypothetical protein